MLSFNYAAISSIYQLGLKNQQLIYKSLNLGLIEEAYRLRQVDGLLLHLLRKAKEFDFIGSIARGRTLLVGEGNLSFALALTKNSRVRANQLVASVYEQRDELTDEAISNMGHLKALGSTVLLGVDATALRDSLGSWLFDTIVFQFPHTGSREPVNGHNPNFILVSDFLKSAAFQLRVSGKVLITTVDSPHYQGAFQFDEAAKIAGFSPPESYPFDPDAFPGYEHTMTHQSGSALDEHHRFRTWIFRK